ncbi:MAG: hypothetical protein V7782_16565, partial [Psychromonas sp.]
MTSREQFLQCFNEIAVKETALPSFEFESPFEDSVMPVKDVFTEVLVKVGGQLGEGNKVSQLQQFVTQKITQGFQVLSVVEGVTGNRDPAQINNPHQLAD